MSRPFRKQVLDGVSSATESGAIKTKGHISLGIFVVAPNLDTSNDTLDVRVEASPTGAGGEWATVDTKQGGGGSKTTRLDIGVNDFEDTDGDGTFVAFLYAHGVPAEYIRANITSFSDNADSDLTADVYLMGANNAGTGHSFET